MYLRFLLFILIVPSEANATDRYISIDASEANATDRYISNYADFRLQHWKLQVE